MKKTLFLLLTTMLLVFLVGCADDTPVSSETSSVPPKVSIGVYNDGTPASVDTSQESNQSGADKELGAESSSESESQTKSELTEIAAPSDPIPPADEPASSSVVSETAGGGKRENFNTYDNEEQQQTDAKWVLNTKSKKIHYPSCDQVKKIAPQNYETSNQSQEKLFEEGYTTCGVCHK